MAKFAVGLFPERVFALQAGYSNTNLIPHSSQNSTLSQFSN
jgi:hypothetical protein